MDNVERARPDAKRKLEEDAAIASIRDAEPPKKVNKKVESERDPPSASPKAPKRRLGVGHLQRQTSSIHSKSRVSQDARKAFQESTSIR